MLSLEALVDLVDTLRAKGYDLGTQECLVASNLLLALDRRGVLPPDPARLDRLLAPVFCSSGLEQAAFYRDYAAWLKRRLLAQAAAAARGQGLRPSDGEPSATSAAAVADNAKTNDQTKDRLTVRHGWLRRVGAVLMAAVGLVGVLGAPWWLSWFGQQQGLITVVSSKPAQVALTSDCAACRVSSPSEGKFVLTYRRWQLPILLTAQAQGLCRETARIEASSEHPAQRILKLQAEPCALAPTEPPKPQSSQLPSVTATQVASTARLPHAGWQAAAAALPALLCLLALLVLGWRTRLALSSAERALPPTLKDLRLSGTGFTLFDRATLRRITQEFRRHRPRATAEIDAQATVAATVEKGGLFTPVLQQRKALPEYLVLIDQAGARDHQTRWAQELVQQLALGGVAVDRFYFSGDPRQVQVAFDKPSCTSAAELLARHHEHVLLIFGSGEGFFDPLSNETQAWLQGFAAWERRVLVTPLPKQRWGWREAALRQQGFVIAPADLGGLQLIASMAEVFRAPGAAPRSFPSLLASGDPRWLERAAPEAGQVTRLAGQLKWYLGPAGYPWLCALALYPQLQWEITLHLGQRLLGDETRVRALLADLIQLPWLRHGQMPQWLRLRLVADLAPEAQARARSAYAELLGGAGAAEGFLLQVASEQALMPRWQRLRQAWRRWRQHAQEQDTARRSHPDSPLRDYAFVTFMRGQQPSKLEMEAPKSWSKLFERGWLPSLPQALSGVLLAGLLGAGTWWSTGQLVTQPMQVVALHLQPSGGLFVRAAGQPSLWLEPGGQQATVGSPATLGREPSALAQLWASTDARSVLVTSADGQWSALADAAGSIEVRSAGAVRVRSGVMASGGVDPQVFALSADGSHLLYAAAGAAPGLASWANGNVSVWPVPTDSSRRVHAVGPTHLALVDAELRALVVYELSPGTMWGVPRRVVSSPPPAGVSALALSADGRWLAAGDSTGAIWQWSLSALANLPTRVGNAGSAIRQLAYTSDGTLLASGGDNATVRLWHPATQESVGLPAGTGLGHVVKLVVQADRLRVAAATDQGQLLVWSLSAPQPIAPPVPTPASPTPPAVETPPQGLPLSQAQVEVLYCAARGDAAAARRVLAQINSSQSVASARLVVWPAERDDRPETMVSGYEIRHAASARAAAQALASQLAAKGLGRFGLRQASTPSPNYLAVYACVPPDTASREEVAAAQQMLALGFGVQMNVDGAWGPQTAALVQRFQKERGLPITGQLDRNTRDALEKERRSAAAQPSGAVTAPEPTPSAGWCCLRQANSSAGQQKQQQQSSRAASPVQEIDAGLCTKLGGQPARSRAAAEQLCSARNAVRLLGLRTSSGAPLVLSTTGDQAPAQLVVDVEVDLVESPVMLELTFHHSFATRGTCTAGGRELNRLFVPVEAAGRRSVSLPLNTAAVSEFSLPGYVGVSARLLAGLKGVVSSDSNGLARAEQTPTACLPYQVATVNNPDAACLSGYVQRGAYGGDSACVLPATRAQVLLDNAAAAERREPEGGPFGANTCRQGYVWREARASDQVCVTPEVRQQTATDNRLSPARSVNQQNKRTGSSNVIR